MRYIKKWVQLFESKKTESEGLNILIAKKVENPQEEILKIKALDKSNNQINIPAMCFFYEEEMDLDGIESTFNIYNDLLKKNKIKPLILADKFTKLKIEDKVYNYTDLIKFREFLDSKMPKITVGQKGTIDTSKSNEKPMWEGNGISIYDGNDVTKCIKYCQGGLTGRSYSFCIGKYLSDGNMFNSYRDTQTSTFYFIVDKNRDMDDPLHVVVFDKQPHGVSLTDTNNNTGNIEEFGTDEDAYVDYLESKGVPVDKLLVNKPKTKQEEEDYKLLSKQNTKLEWFTNLPVMYRSRYVGMGHLLSDEQFDYLMENPNADR